MSNAPANSHGGAAWDKTRGGRGRAQVGADLSIIGIWARTRGNTDSLELELEVGNANCTHGAEKTDSGQIPDKEGRNEKKKCPKRLTRLGVRRREIRLAFVQHDRKSKEKEKASRDRVRAVERGIRSRVQEATSDGKSPTLADLAATFVPDRRPSRCCPYHSHREFDFVHVPQRSLPHCMC